MANTIMSAKNSFQEGLIMDFSPDNTQANCMTSALNATLVTYNGNEMQLQNDMGNGRVETARLPEGYVPVGSCEFGDIIYIVSYNPLTNKSQIGCFPSPERNISSDELYEAGEQGYQNLSYTDFQDTDFQDTKLTGKLARTSVKKVLIDSKKINPGDKYIIYTDTNSITLNESCLSDCYYDPDNKIINGEHNGLSKYVKLHVVSIEDSGKITYLDSTTKWYKTGDYKYYLSSQKIGTDKEADLDSYRDLVSSNWSIFNSKVSGKLAILAELEMIKEFSCSYNVELLDTKISESDSSVDIKYKRYKVFLCPEYDKESKERGITLPYICLTKAAFNNKLPESPDVNQTHNIDRSRPDTVTDQHIYYYTKNKGVSKIVWKKGTEDTIVDEVNIPAITADDQHGWAITGTANEEILIGIVEVPYQQRIKPSGDKNPEWENIKSDSFIYNLEVTPAMQYGRLEHLAVQLSIDFNKIGTGEVSLNTWKYHNVGSTSILTFGIDAYPKPNYQVTDVIIQFFDNQGLVGEYLLNDKKYYSGVFTEYIGLDGEVTNSRLTRFNSIGNYVIEHKGEKIEGSIPDNSNENNYVIGDDGTYINDAGTLYSGVLYAARIIVLQKHEKKVKKEESSSIYRWYWTNPMFNDYYYSVKDFKELKFELALDGEALFETTDQYSWKTKELNNLSNTYEGSDHYKTYSANAQYIGYGGDSNLNMYVRAGLINDYGCFNLYRTSGIASGGIESIDLGIYLGRSEIKYNISGNQYEYSVKEANITDPGYLSLNNSVNDEDNVIQITDVFDSYLEHPETIASRTYYSGLSDLFNIYFISPTGSEDMITDEGTISTSFYKGKLLDCYYSSQTDKEPIPLSMQALIFNKAYSLGEQGGTVQVPVYTPIIDTMTDLTPLGIVPHTDDMKSIALTFDQGIALNHKKNLFSGAKLLPDGNGTFISVETDDYNIDFGGGNKMIDTATSTEFLNDIWGKIGTDVKTFFPVYFGGWGSGHDVQFNAISGSSKNYQSTASWRDKYMLGADTTTSTSKVTTGNFDIKDYALSEVTTQNSTSFLGIKYKDGMTLLNNAFIDTTNEGGTSLNQKANSRDALGYENFAYQLFLLLTNTYHKNKKANDRAIKLKNFVRNGDYQIELIKHVIIQLCVAEGTKSNILMKHMDFNDYVSKICTNTAKVCGDDLSNFGQESNVTLKLLSVAKDHELKIVVNSEPMTFFETQVEAYMQKNGLLKPISDLAPNNFYVYQNNELNIYTSGTLTFNIDDIKANLRYIFETSEENVNLRGIKLRTTYALTSFEKAYNNYLGYLNSFVLGTTYAYHGPYDSREAAQEAMYQYINTVFGTFPESEEGYARNVIRSEFQKDGIISDVFQLYDNGLGEHAFSVQIHANVNEYMKTGTPDVPTYCEFATHNFLGFFDYQDFFQANSSQPIGSTFGIKDGGNNGASSYTGFARNILLDTNYRVLK